LIPYPEPSLSYGILITEAYRDFTRKQIQSEFASLDDFLQRWNSAQKKQVIIPRTLLATGAGTGVNRNDHSRKPNSRLQQYRLMELGRNVAWITQ